MLSNTAWSKNQHVLNEDDARSLLDDAYSRTQALNERTNERFDPAGHDEISDPNWLKLNEEETSERTEALDAVRKAREAVQAVKDAM